VPAILWSRDTVRAIQWRARRPALPSEDKSESDILRLGLQASKVPFHFAAAPVMVSDAAVAN